jgi:hypothetical protein
MGENFLPVLYQLAFKVTFPSPCQASLVLMTLSGRTSPVPMTLAGMSTPVKGTVTLNYYKRVNSPD